MPEYPRQLRPQTIQELLSVILRSEKNAEMLARMPLQKLQDATASELGISQSAYDRLSAAIELGRRVEESKTNYEAPAKLDSSSKAIQFCQSRFKRLISDCLQEQFHTITLNTKLGVIDTHCITIGTLDASLVHPREVFRPALKDAASAIILAHNHPSGDPTPSAEDIQVTRRLESAGETLGIPVQDHIVMGKDGMVSIRESEVSF